MWSLFYSRCSRLRVHKWYMRNYWCKNKMNVQCCKRTSLHMPISKIEWFVDLHWAGRKCNVFFMPNKTWFIWRPNMGIFVHALNGIWMELRDCILQHCDWNIQYGRLHRPHTPSLQYCSSLTANRFPFENVHTYQM